MLLINVPSMSKRKAAYARWSVGSCGIDSEVVLAGQLHELHAFTRLLQVLSHQRGLIGRDDRVPGRVNQEHRGRKPRGGPGGGAVEHVRIVRAADHGSPVSDIVRVFTGLLNLEA